MTTNRYRSEPTPQLVACLKMLDVFEKALAKQDAEIAALKLRLFRGIERPYYCSTDQIVDLAREGGGK